MPENTPLTSWSLRIALPRAGWHTELRISRNGICSSPSSHVSVGFWARTWYWKGWISDVCLHEHDIIDLEDADAHARVLAVMTRLKAACEDATERFVDTIPCQVTFGTPKEPIELKENSWALEHVNPARDIFPTEDIALGTELLSAPAGEDHVSKFLDAARQRFEVEDDMNTYIGRARYLHDCKNRQWGYAARLRKRRHGDVPLSATRPTRLSVEELDEAIASGLIDLAADRIQRNLKSFGPGGALHGATANGLPPGKLTRAEYLASQNGVQTAPDTDDET